MIVPMIKYNFLIHHSQVDTFLGRLSDVGVMDITVSDYQLSAEQTAMASEIASVAKVKEMLSQRTVEESGPAAEIDAPEAVKLYGESVVRMEQLASRTAKLKKELDECAMWGDFSKEKIDELASSGVYLHFYMALAKEFTSGELQQQYTVVPLGERSSMILFAIVSRSEAMDENLGNLAPMKLPEYTYSQKREELEAVEAERESCSREIDSLVPLTPKIEEYRLSLEERLDFSKARSSSQSASDGYITLIEGWVPEESTAKVDSEFEHMDSLVMIKDKPTLEDEPPVLLKNGPFARMAELVTNLYSLPKYHAVDLTPYFAPWFIFFVGICFADLIYGAVTLALGLFLKLKGKSEMMKITGSLVVWCSASTMVMGFITGNAGGLMLADMEIFEPIKWIFLGQTDMFYFALGVGILQILYGMVVKAYTRAKRFGFVYCLSTVGWASVIVSTILAVALPEVGVDFSMESTLYTVILYAGLAVSVLLYDPKKSIFSSAGAGLWALYNSITGLFSDTLSYVRLFALGLSGGIIASVFNDLAVGMSGDIPVVKYIIMILILLVGHGINLFMSAIGSFVHPLRLTFVEFYNNADFEAGGRAYNPFSRKIGEKKEKEIKK